MPVYDLDKFSTLGTPKEGGRWMVVCKHASVVQVDARKLARELNKHPEEFCDYCKKEAEHETRR